MLLIAIFVTLCVGSGNAQESCPTPRGGATLALLHSRFPVNDAINTLSWATPHSSFAFVVKSFGNSYGNVEALISGLLNHPLRPSRCVTVVVYVECGPCRPPRRNPGLFPLIAPTENIGSLNRGLERNKAHIVRAFIRDIARIQSKLPQIPGVKYVIEPGLEDNFTRPAFHIIASLIKQEFQLRDDWRLGSNTVGNRLRAGVHNEIHTFLPEDLRRLRSGDILSGDGVMYDPSRAFIRKATSKGVNILLWRPEWQGLPSQPSTHFKSISQRRYRFTDQSAIKKLLRR